ncbi:MAG TPA: PHB depolymerase family esterase [Burkholderiaceae bacterium]
MTAFLVPLLRAIGALLLSLSLCHAAPPLPAIGARVDLTTVSGISSGAALAEQFSVAYSSIVVGKALIAAIPYGCALYRKGKRTGAPLWNALTTCTDPAAYGIAPPDAAVLFASAQQQAARGAIDPVAMLARQQVYVFTGMNDAIVARAVALQTVRFAQLAGVASDAIVYKADVAAGHGFIVDRRGAVACEQTAPPFINDCRLMLAHAMLHHIYRTSAPLSQPAAPPLSAAVAAFDQSEFGGGMDGTGYVYIPAACRAGGCKVHIALHGCRQTAATIADAFYGGAGYNELADSNGIVVLYPQAKRSVLPLNPYGCWDYWGYSGADFTSRRAPQLAALRAMLARLASRAD